MKYEEQDIEPAQGHAEQLPGPAGHLIPTDPTDPRAPMPTNRMGRLGTMGLEATKAADARPEDPDDEVTTDPTSAEGPWGPEDPQGPSAYTPQAVQTLMAQTGQYLMDVGYIMRRVPDVPMDQVEKMAIARAMDVVLQHLMIVRERLVAMRLVLDLAAQGYKGSEDSGSPTSPVGLEGPVDYEDTESPEYFEDPEDLDDPEDYEVPDEYTKGCTEGAPSKSDLLGAEAPESAVTADLTPEQLHDIVRAGRLDKLTLNALKPKYLGGPGGAAGLGGDSYDVV